MSELHVVSKEKSKRRVPGKLYIAYSQEKPNQTSLCKYTTRNQPTDNFYQQHNMFYMYKTEDNVIIISLYEWQMTNCNLFGFCLILSLGHI